MTAAKTSTSTQKPATGLEPITVLGIETSCDDTAAAVVRRDVDGRCRVLSNEVWSQHTDHKAFGGVVPEIAARSHVERVDLVIERAMDAAALGFADLDAIAATGGPGLVGGVMVGATAGKAIALAHGKPLIPINHLEGHALSAGITDVAPPPYLLLLISGGHTQLVSVDGIGAYERLGTTIDDAAGEAFDKTAKLLGLGQPGGPRIESAAVGGRAERFSLPRPLAKRAGCDFSFSGLKTALRLEAEALTAPTGQDVADLAAAFQKTVARHLVDRTVRAMEVFARRNDIQFLEGRSMESRRLVVAGGVAANCEIKASLKAACDELGWSLIAPHPKYCTDNGAMIAWAGALRFAGGLVPSIDEALAFAPRARWPLADPPPGRAQSGGKKGPKA